MRYVLSAICLLCISCGGANRVVEDTYESGQVKVSGEIKSHKQEGAWKYYYPDGTLKSEGAWLKDYQDGPWTYYYPNGKKKQSGDYVSKHRQGTWTYWYENGKVKTRGRYDNDRQDGLWYYFREDGTLFAIGQYIAGIKHGMWQWYAADGKPANYGLFYDGVRIGPWRIDGKTVSKGSPENIELRQAKLNDMSIFGLYENDKALLVGAASDKRVLGAFDAKQEFFTLLNENGHSVEESTEHINVFVADGNLVGTADSESRIGDYQKAKKALQSIFSQLNKQEPEAEAAPSVEEIIVSKKDEPALTPVVHIDSLWTKREEEKAGDLILRYKKFMPGDDDHYSSGNKKRQMQKEWMKKPLPRTRFFDISGQLVDLKSLEDKKSATIIVMRGFAGQVCVYCSTQTRALAEKVEEFKALDNEVYIVYPGPAETIPMFLKAVESVGGDASNLNIVLDVNLGLVKELKIQKDLAKPSSIILDKSGKVVYGYIGTNMGDRPSTRELLGYVKRAR